MLEFVEKGDFFNYIFYSNKGLGERNGKLIFYKILKSFQFFHIKGICHRELKMENILMDQKFQPKLADFCFATFIKGKDGSNLIEGGYGTKPYIAPELLKGEKYNGSKADIFSLGAVLLTLVSCHIIFGEAS